MNKKAAIQLSVQFIVLTVLALITLGIGFYLVTNIFTTAEEYKVILDKETQENIISTLKKSGEILSLPITSYTIKRGDNEIVAFGVLNNIGTDSTFTISIVCTEAIAPDDTELCAVNKGIPCGESAGQCSRWIILDTEEETLQNRESLVAGLFIQVPNNAPSGIFGYSIKVYTGNTQYGTTKKLYITVPE
ncbi:hypothetical protein COV16_05655 [Candidatus Woesearchaeota archaeon CG10_big_fil_rev_8_21_14_0_10_34_8]|nr:MAG: hypothetical protein COV16_05655 [Candidatus Woesearchaeota archaeon CG10_big_fil_rev_8_21_14_0_10_34_8]